MNVFHFNPSSVVGLGKSLKLSELWLSHLQNKEQRSLPEERALQAKRKPANCVLRSRCSTMPWAWLPPAPAPGRAQWDQMHPGSTHATTLRGRAHLSHLRHCSARLVFPGVFAL